MERSSRSLSRFGLEFLLIVAGVLTALTVDAWWQRHTERVREQEYLVQLLADAHDNQRRLNEALVLENGQLRRADAVLAALRSGHPLNADSVMVWMNREPTFPWYSDPRLLGGAMVALVETGDIHIIRDHKLRSAIVAYLGQLEADLAEFSRGITPFQDHSDRLYRVMELARPAGSDVSDDQLGQALLAIQDNPETQVIFRLLRTNIKWRIWYVDQMAEGTDAYIAVLTAAQRD